MTERSQRTARSPTIVEHRITGTGDAPYDVAVTGDGAVWITLISGHAVLRRTVDGAIGRIPLGEAARPALCATASNDSVWVTDTADGRLVQIGPEGVRRAVSVPTPDAGPFGVAAAITGDVWFTEMQADSIGCLHADGTVTEIPSGPAGGMPSMIASSGAGIVFTLNQGNAIGRLPSGGDAVEIIDLPTDAAGPVGITVARDGAVWFAEIIAGQIGRMDRQGTITEFPLPDRSSKPHAVESDPAGGCWFTLWGSTQLGHIAEDGAMNLIDLPTPGSEPHGLAVAADGTVWVALEAGLVAEVRP
ncbi:virginiamycin B lyase [Citricoccus sp.]|uniref:Vgb family protein n=1 Tax=Citricoccus sp. TaxID=1978372 RepID=UPI0028BDC55B|nr:virginiamycin B lyase [Citricoccus sp.]